MFKDLINKNITKIIIALAIVLVLIIVLIYNATRNSAYESTKIGYPARKDATYTVPTQNVPVIKNVVTDNGWGKYVLFSTTKECPGCRTVEKYITDNNVDSKIKIDKVSVFDNTKGTDLIEKVDDLCRIALKHSGVPLLFDTTSDKCYSTVDTITSFLGSQLK